MKNIKLEKTIILLLLTLLGIFFFVVSYTSQGTYDSGDGIRHYLVSRYCWLHPSLLLYSWGKPFFTLISSPFSQFGLLGINVFNIFCALFSSWFCFLIAKKLNMKFAFTVIIFLCFTPIYFATINSGLTEPLFGLILIASIYLMIVERFLLSAVVISFLPFVRSEGNLILPLFFLFLLYKRKYLTSIFTGCGTLLYSVAGLFYYHDFFWIKNQNPYNGQNRSFYGQGDLLYFFSSYNNLWGKILFLLFVIGLVSLVFRLFSKSANAKENKVLAKFINEENILITGSFIIYFVAHSVMWWKGWANSLGLLRVVAGVMPCSAILCLGGFNFLIQPFERLNKKIKYFLFVCVLFFVVRSPFKGNFFPYNLDAEQLIVKQAGEWFQTSQYKGKMVYYLYPYLAHVLNVDPFDTKKVQELWGLYPTIKKYGIGAIPDSTVVIWDAHFGPNECKIPLDTILNDENFELIKNFKPAKTFKTLGDHDFEINVFLKLMKARKKQLLEKNIYDFETFPQNLLNTDGIETGNTFSGKRFCRLSEKHEYSATVIKTISEFSKNTSEIKFMCNVFAEKDATKNALIVLSVEDKEGKSLMWNSSALELQETKEGTKWNRVESKFFLSPISYTQDAVVKIYVWNKKLKDFLVDDFIVEYWGRD